MTNPNPETIHVEIFFSSRKQDTQPATLNIAEVLEWAGLDSHEDLTDALLKEFVEEHDPEGIIGWGEQQDLIIYEVERDY